MKVLKYIFLILLLSMAACTSSPNSDAPLADKNHVASFVNVHMIEARVEVDSCKTCHGADYLGGTVGVSCLGCHLSGPPFTTHTASWANARDGHQTFGNDFSWTNCANAACHGTDLRGGALSSTITGPSCFSDSTASGSCHLAGPPAPTATNPIFVHTGTFTDPAEHGVAAKINQIKCRNCHGRPNNIFDGGFVAAAAILNNADGNCANSSCHPAATAHPTEWQGLTDDIDATYDSTHRAVPTSTIAASCALCHLTTSAGVGPMATAPSCYSSTFTNANSTVSNCHADGPGPFHTTSHFAWDGTCANCHSGTNIVVDVHNATCSLCHTSVNGGDARITGTDGSAIGATTATTCTGCHSTGTGGAITKAFVHHDTTNAQSGTCTYCHADPRPGWQTAEGLFTPVGGIPTQLFCIKCHIDTSGADYVVNKLSYVPVNVTSLVGESQWGVNGDAAVVTGAAVHTIPTLGAVGNYGACLGCHASGYVSEITTNQAQKIQVWHAKPTWNKGAVAGDGSTAGNTDDADDTLDNTFDVLRSSPGRSYYDNATTPAINVAPTIARYNIFAPESANDPAIAFGTGGVSKMRMVDRYDFGDSGQPYDGTASATRGEDFYQIYKLDANNPWAQGVWPNRLTIPRNSINNADGLMSSDPMVPIP